MKKINDEWRFSLSLKHKVKKRISVRRSSFNEFIQNRFHRKIFVKKLLKLWNLRSHYLQCPLFGEQSQKFKKLYSFLFFNVVTYTRPLFLNISLYIDYAVFWASTVMVGSYHFLIFRLGEWQKSSCLQADQQNSFHHNIFQTNLLKLWNLRSRFLLQLLFFEKSKNF